MRTIINLLKCFLLWILGSSLGSAVASSGNPLVTNIFTADPTGLVFGGRLYVYTSHDEPDAAYWDMVDWRLLSTTDLAKWNDHGSIFRVKDFAWATRWAWAPDCIQANGMINTVTATKTGPAPAGGSLGSAGNVPASNTGATTASSDRNTGNPRKWGEWKTWGDQGDGTYRNPVIPSDYSDIDCIRVGADYYAISSTFQFSPGMVILHSRDLVNWSIKGHAVTDLTQIGPGLNWDRMGRYGRGIWAGAIRYHRNRFWIYFGTPDEGYFMTTAKDISGPWEPLHHVLKEAGWDDCCPFWDDDGRGYLVGTNFRDNYKTYLFKLTPDGRDLVGKTGQLINEGSGREANKLYKFNGTYYHFYSEHQESIGRYVMMRRSKNILGPYAEVKQLSHADRPDMEPNQGGIVQTEKGEWYFFAHHGTGSWEGRCASLLPVTWIDGWPIIGQIGPDGIGHMVWSGKKPVQGKPVVTPQTDDEFSGTRLRPQWEWNYQPRTEKWSLMERAGFLRLHAFKPLRADEFMAAGNTLTQRSMRTKENVVTIFLDLRGMADGQVAGLCHFSRDNSTLGIRQKGTTLSIECTRDKMVAHGPPITCRRIWLRSTWGLDGKSQYSYSVDGTDFTPFGEPYPLSWGNYRGDRIGIFTYNHKGEKGFVDADWFRYTFSNQKKPVSRR
jgi:beta-xylosidase